MTTSTISHTEIIQKVALLPPETLPALDEFIALLERRVARPKKEPNLPQRIPGGDEGLIIIGEDFDNPLPEFVTVTQEMVDNDVQTLKRLGL